MIKNRMRDDLEADGKYSIWEAGFKGYGEGWHMLLILCHRREKIAKERV